MRLLGDRKRVSQPIAQTLSGLARNERDIVVRSQLACTAKRLPAEVAMNIVGGLIRHAGDENDVHLPLLLWWAIENKAISDMPVVLQLLDPKESWQLPMMRQHLLRRLARRLAAEETPESLAACAKLLRQAPGEQEVDLLLAGLTDALAGRRQTTAAPNLQRELERLAKHGDNDSRLIELAVRMGASPQPALAFVGDAQQPETQRVAVIQALGETRTRTAIAPLLSLATTKQPPAVQMAALSALGYFEEPRIAKQLLASYAQLSAAAKPRTIDLLCGRRDWAARLMDAVADKSIDRQDVELSHLRQLTGFDERMQARVVKIWGSVQAATPLEMRGRISAVQQAVNRGKGDVGRGRVLFEKSCASCHKFQDKGTKLGPDLTGAERKDRLKLIANIVDPNAVIRPQYITYVAVTEDGRQLTGMLAGSDEKTVTLVDAKNKRTIFNRQDLEQLRESPVSLMPEGLLKPLTDQQIRDLITYLQSDPPDGEKPAPKVLSGTDPLTVEGDLATHVVAGVDRFLLRELAASVERRQQYWHRDTSSATAYTKSVEENRQRF